MRGRARPITRSAVAVAALMLVMVPALSSSASQTAVTAQGRGATAEPASGDNPKPTTYDDYVALGDSFTAGPLIPRIRLDPLGCARSTSNYPAFLAAYFKVKTYTDVSCSAAETIHMSEPQATFAGTNAPQLDVLDEGTDLVTLGIGGNDYSLFGDLITECAKVRESDPTGAPCKEKYTVAGVDTKIRDAKRIEARVAAVVAGIKERSPSATVVVVNYLRILPPSGTCPDVVPFADGDYAWGNEVEKQLNTSLRNAARSYQATYVNMFPASLGHDACRGSEAWVNGSELKPLRAYPYHPFRSGMRGIAKQTYRTLTDQPAPSVAPRIPDVPTMSRQDQLNLSTLLIRQPPIR